MSASPVASQPDPARSNNGRDILDMDDAELEAELERQLEAMGDGDESSPPTPVSASSLARHGGEEDDELYDEAVNFVIESRRASISAVQRKLRIGYNRAARLIESMEAAGLVSEMSSNGSREVLVPKRN